MRVPMMVVPTGHGISARQHYQTLQVLLEKYLACSDLTISLFGSHQQKAGIPCRSVNFSTSRRVIKVWEVLSQAVKQAPPCLITGWIWNEIDLQSKRWLRFGQECKRILILFCWCGFLGTAAGNVTFWLVLSIYDPDRLYSSVSNLTSFPKVK